MREGKQNWVNVNDLKGWDSPIMTQLGILGTPALFLLDSELKLLGRASSFEHLQKIVRDMLEP